MKSSLSRPKRVPVRTCVACRTAGGKRGLLRVVRLPEEAGIVVDSTGKRNGRGAYVCPTTVCITLALKRKALERSLKTPIPVEVAETLQSMASVQDALEVINETSDN